MLKFDFESVNLCVDRAFEKTLDGFQNIALDVIYSFFKPVNEEKPVVLSDCGLEIRSCQNNGMNGVN
jgi:hypothetical protein